jgi:hypothetical protein
VTEQSGPKRPPGMRSVQIEEKRAKRLAALADAKHVVPINFSIVGVQKAGTSSLYRMLVKHRQVAAGPEKEMRLFMDESRDWDHPDYAEFARPVRRASVRWAGDATPAYLFWPKALRRMRDFDADLRLIAAFRDPVERAFSHWSMERAWGPSFPDLATVLEDYGTAPLPEQVPAGVSPAELRRRTMFSRGLYGEQLRRGLELFPREQWLLLDFRSMLADTHGALDATTDFLDLPRFEEYPEQLHSNRTPTNHVGEGPTLEAFARLVEMYADDLPLFAELSGLEVGHWPTAQVVAGTLPVEEFHAGALGKLGLL